MAVVGAPTSAALRFHHDVRSTGTALGNRTLNSPSLPPVAPGRATKDLLRSWEASRRNHKNAGHHSWRIPSLKKANGRSNWRCFAELKSSEPDAETADPRSAADCCNDAAGQEESTSATDLRNEASTTGVSEQVFETYGPGKRGNQLVALASSSIAVGLFLFGRFGGGGPALPELAATSVPYEEALTNGRPTVLEFYADWCEVCKETARDVFQVEQEYRDRINFVMLNVDNSKWEQELDEFGVEGIPHFAFLDKEGNEEGNIVGRLPRTILKENLAALARGDTTVPHSRVVGQFSSAESRSAPPVVGPRSHSPTS